MSEGLTIETMRQRTRGHRALERRLDELLRPDPGPPPSDEHRRRIEENRRRQDEELKQRLVQGLTQDERRKISVIVIDVSKPSRPSGEK